MYVTNNSTETIWSQEQSVVISKLRDCMKLNEEYQRCFQQVKAKLALTSNERPFDFSEMYIFGKFDSFIRRCEHIIENFMTMNVYSSLAESNIEGIGIYYTKFQSIVSILKKKEHDVLDQRKQDIENDFEDFHRSIDDLHRNLNEFFEKYFQTMKNTERALNTLKRFEKLQIPNLGLNEKYAQILQQYSKDLDLVAKIYQKHSSEPPLTRDLPPIAGKQSFFFLLFKYAFVLHSGRITWARQLYKRIQEPMAIFTANKTILQYTEAKQIIKNYNQLSKVLLSYEILYHRGWLRQIDVICTGVHSSVLICFHQDEFSTISSSKTTSTSSIIVSTSEVNPDYHVNFDRNILELIRETKCLARLGLEIPSQAILLTQREENFKRINQLLNQFVEKNQEIRQKIQPPFQTLLLPRIQRLNDIIKPGLTSITWVSLTIDDYIQTVCFKRNFFSVAMKSQSLF